MGEFCRSGTCNVTVSDLPMCELSQGGILYFDFANTIGVITSAFAEQGFQSVTQGLPRQQHMAQNSIATSRIVLNAAICTGTVFYDTKFLCITVSFLYFLYRVCSCKSSETFGMCL